ncbi:hypothetical protein AKJ16_DCAP01327 [Drosera capensis]
MAATAITTALSTFISTLIPKPPPPPPRPPHLTFTPPPIPTITSGLTLTHHPTSVPSNASPAVAYSNVFYLKHRMDDDYEEEEEISWDYADEAIDQFFRELRREGLDAEWRRRMRFENNRERKIRKAMEAKIKDKWMRIEEREEREAVKTNYDSRFMGSNFFLERIRNEKEQDAREPLEARVAWEEGEEAVEEAAASFEGEEGEQAVAYYVGEEGEEAVAYHEGEEGEAVMYHESEEAVAYHEGEEGEAVMYYEGEEGGEGEEVVEEVWTYHDLDDWDREFGE